MEAGYGLSTCYVELQKETYVMAKTKKSPAVDKTLAIMKQKAESRKKKSARAKAPIRTKMAKPEASKAPIRKGSFTKQELQYFKQIILEKRKEILEELSPAPSRRCPAPYV